MKINSIGMIACIGLVFVFEPLLLVGAEQTPPQKAKVLSPGMQRYKETVKYLDRGGDFLLYVSTEGVVKEMLDQFAELLAAVPGDAAQTAEARKILAKVKRFIMDIGADRGTGLGISSKPLANGQSLLRAFMGRDPAAAQLPLWKIFGGRARDLKCLRYLPQDTVVVRAANIDMPELWRVFKKGVADIGGLEAKQEFDADLKGMAESSPYDVDKIMLSLGDELLVSLQLSRVKTIEAPGGGPTTVPEPSVLIVLATQNKTLYEALTKQLAAGGQPPVKTVVDGTELVTGMIPAPLPIKLEPTLAMHDGYLLFASSKAAMHSALKAAKDKGGLIHSPEYGKAMQGMPKKMNGLIYVSPRLFDAVSKWQKQNTANPAAAMTPFAGSFFSAKRVPHPDIYVRVNVANGIYVKGRGQTGGAQILLAAPIGLMSAIAIPSFVKSRTTSMQNACINNLRIMDSAKEQWAMAQNKSAGSKVVMQDVRMYMRRVPVCPQGGIYTLGVIGKDPTCSMPGHTLKRF